MTSCPRHYCSSSFFISSHACWPTKARRGALQRAQKCPNIFLKLFSASTLGRKAQERKRAELCGFSAIYRFIMVYSKLTESNDLVAISQREQASGTCPSFFKLKLNVAFRIHFYSFWFCFFSMQITPVFCLSFTPSWQSLDFQMLTYIWR